MTTTVETISETIWVVQTWQGQISAISDTIFSNYATSVAIVIALNDLGLLNQIVEIELGESFKIFQLLDKQGLADRLQRIYMDVKRTEDSLRHLGNLLKPINQPWTTTVIAEIEALLV